MRRRTLDKQAPEKTLAYLQKRAKPTTVAAAASAAWRNRDKVATAQLMELASMMADAHDDETALSGSEP